MKGTPILNGELVDMISRLNSENRRALAKYASFLLDAQERERPQRQARRKAALEALSKHQGILGDEDPGEILAEAMREKYGNVSRKEYDRVLS